MVDGGKNSATIFLGFFVYIYVIEVRGILIFLVYVSNLGVKTINGFLCYYRAAFLNPFSLC